MQTLPRPRHLALLTLAAGPFSDASLDIANGAALVGMAVEP